MIDITFKDTLGNHEIAVAFPTTKQDLKDPMDFLFRFGRSSIEATKQALATLRWPNFTIGWGKLAPTSVEILANVVGRARQEHPIQFESPFEGSTFISGGVWDCKGANDAIVPLEFAVGCNDLPPHIHRYSDRLILILGGKGTMHYMSDASDTFIERDFSAREISTGDLIVFMRGAIHTFSTDQESLHMLSYHDPFVPLDDSTQYEVVSA